MQERETVIPGIDSKVQNRKQLRDDRGVHRKKKPTPEKWGERQKKKKARVDHRQKQRRLSVLLNDRGGKDAYAPNIGKFGQHQGGEALGPDLLVADLSPSTGKKGSR